MVRKTALVGRALLSKALIQLSADDWVPSLVVVCPEVTQPWGLRGSMEPLMVNSKRAYANKDLSGLLLPVQFWLCPPRLESLFFPVL